MHIFSDVMGLKSPLVCELEALIGNISDFDSIYHLSIIYYLFIIIPLLLCFLNDRETVGFFTVFLFHVTEQSGLARGH